MLGLSYGEVFLLLGATAALIGPKDLPKVARVAGRLVGRAVGYVQSARGQMENVLQQAQANQVHKELQDTLAQLEAIRHEIRSISIMNPGPMTRRMVDNSGLTPSNDADVDKCSTGLEDTQRAVDRVHKNMEDFSKLGLAWRLQALETTEPRSTQLQSQATTYARLAESPTVKDKCYQAVAFSESPSANQEESLEGLPKAGQTVVLPVSAESAGLLPTHKDCVSGSDVVLVAILEADVAQHAKEFFKQPEAQSFLSSTDEKSAK